ncbi:MAG: carboxypeptidase regulatory-like domain-containing protein [Proteobacteria bacterium]|nr:carboxypeptidase regulatory-like domain-containing protein [Pseudomonadota bacterium]
MKRHLIAVASATLALLTWAVQAQAPASAKRAYPEGFISGRVLNGAGPEAGVWVIAETQETNTPFVKIVVTDDAGRFTLPQLPDATYNVWVRGYGLVDSPKVKGRPGDAGLELKVQAAKDAREAAKVYPGDYWLSLLEVPAASSFPGTGGVANGGNGFMPGILSQDDWMHRFKKDCNFCHQLGNQLTRTLTHMDAEKLGFKSHEDAWLYRTTLGVRGTNMAAAFLQFGGEGMAKTMADWTRSVESGAVPPAPPRPQGIERNVVVTLWDIGGPQDFMHDEIATDKNRPTVNAYGPIYAVSAGHGTINVVDPVTNDAWKVVIPTREDPRKVATRFPPAARPSNFWGMEHLWGKEHPSDPHNPMMDERGRVWNTSKIRNDEPAFCKEGSQNKFAKYYPLRNSFRQASVYDPATGKFELIDTCYSTHHLQFANDADRTLYFNELTGPIFGWLNTRLFDQTHDEQLSQGWCPQIIDTNGDGRITKPWNAANSAKPDPKLDTEVRRSLYSVIPDPTNANIVWGASEGANGVDRGFIVRLDRGSNPPGIVHFGGLSRAQGHPESAGHRHRQPGSSLGGDGRHIAVGPLRSQQVHADQWPWRRQGRPVCRGLDGVADAGSEIQGQHLSRRLPLLRLGGPARCLGPRQGHAYPHRLQLRLADRAGSENRQMDVPARALSAGLLPARPGWPHR